MKTLTIFTPTYNRAYILPQLYNSLLDQTCSDFVWLVVDDGSIDDTANLIETWISENKICIQYIKQPNGGKHRAHNAAVGHCQTPWFVCVDSDDYMLPIAVECIIQRIVSLDDSLSQRNIGGLVSPKKLSQVVHKMLLADKEESTLSGLYKKGFGGETTLVYRTEVLKQFPFPEFTGEKFVTEAVIYDEIDKNYNLSVIAQPLVVCEYREDGYSRNEKRLFLKNPQGWAYRFNQRAHNPQTLKERYVCCAKYVCFSWMAHQPWFRGANYQFLSLLSLPLAIYYKYTRYKE
ncbi:MAG: glycosyltransferase family 2 protein [Paludibacteraceae bacterium]